MLPQTINHAMFIMEKGILLGLRKGGGKLLDVLDLCHATYFLIPPPFQAGLDEDRQGDREEEAREGRTGSCSLFSFGFKLMDYFYYSGKGESTSLLVFLHQSYQL